MDANLYQDLTKKTELYSEASVAFDASNTHGQTARLEYLSLQYCTLKLNGEAGEFAEIVGKAFRGNMGVLTPEQVELAVKELGDICWYVARLADILGYRLSEVMETNIAKLQDRQQRGVLHGYGDKR